jgi:hypothetical protein
MSTLSILQQNISTEIAIAQEEKKEKKTWQETVPKGFHTFEKVFTKESFDAVQRPASLGMEVLSSTPITNPVNADDLDYTNAGNQCNT